MCDLCQIGFSHETGGFVVPKFHLDLGKNFKTAKTTTNSKDLPKQAQRLGVLNGKLTVLPRGTTMAKARLKAKGGGTVVQSVAKNENGLVIWEKLEKIDSNADGAPVDHDGIVLCKVARPGEQITSISNQLANELAYQDRKWVAPYLKKFLEQLEGINWDTEKDIRKAFAKAERVLRNANVEPLVKPWVQRVEIYGQRSARDGRQWLRQAFLPRISGSLTGADKKAVGAVSTQQGWFLRDMTGRRADNLTARGREIVQAGLRDGLGKQAIADQLKLAMPDLWNKYGNQYAQVCASVAVNRARSVAMVNSYQEAGIQELEITAVLDQRTTEQCRFMDGQIISVEGCAEVINATAEMESPEDIYTTNPFIHVQRNEQGIKELVTARGDKLAEIVRSGYGRLDDRGVHRQFISGRNLPSAASIGMPPYHHLCRTTTVPVFRSFQVPRNYMARSIQGPSPIPQTVYTLARLTGLKANRPVDRPFTLIKEPKPTKPVEVGYKDPATGDPYVRDGLLAEEDLVDQVKERTTRAIQQLQNEVTEAIRSNAGRTLSQKQKGTVLKNAIRKGAGGTVLEKAEIRLSDREQGDMFYGEQRKIIKLLKSVLGDRLIKTIARRKFPRVIEDTSNKVRPKGSWDGKVLTLPRSGTQRADSIIVETVTKYLDTFGKNGRAGVLARNGSCIGGNLITQTGDVFIPIRNSDWRCGRVYGNTDSVKAVGPWDVIGGSPEANDWSSIGNSALTDGQEDRLALLWDMNPDHVGFIASYIEGQFV